MRKREKIIVVAGEFDPLTIEDIRFLKKARIKGDWLIVGVHSDQFMQLCRGGFVMNLSERKEIVESLKCVNEVFQFNDLDGTVCNLLKLIKFCYPSSDIHFVSDEDMHNMPETKISGITFEVIKQGE